MGSKQNNFNHTKLTIFRRGKHVYRGWKETVIYTHIRKSENFEYIHENITL